MLIDLVLWKTDIFLFFSFFSLYVGFPMTKLDVISQLTWVEPGILEKEVSEGSIPGELVKNRQGN